ncbi:uncharacterized protein LOC142560117 [Dermacentor variabilis]|uniref:uncharacterized protein LOC142560117 n=1 Tax=Dermacentor variabilis TaxID=34621 RepID=UPI003F5C41A9
MGFTKKTIVAASSGKRMRYEINGFVTWSTTSFRKARTALVLKSGSSPRKIAGCRGIQWLYAKGKCFLLSLSVSRHSRKTWRTVNRSPHLPQVGGSLPVKRKLVLNKNVQDCEILAALTTSWRIPLSQEGIE